MFTAGERYQRRALHERYGGQRQGGISTPSLKPLIFLFTGEQGAAYGYHDGPQPDGTFWYTGEGQVGDMQMERGNRAIREHKANDKSLHLFEYVSSGQVLYVGEAIYLRSHVEAAPDRAGTPRQAIVFELALTEGSEHAGVAGDLTDPAPREARWWSMPLAALRQLAQTAGAEGTTAQQRKVRTYERSEAVRVYVLRCAEGQCEGCGNDAPFLRKDGRPYLEPHHLRRRADGGPDHPRWVAALCPNCHRRVHSGADGKDVNRRLGEHLATLEPDHDP